MKTPSVKIRICHRLEILTGIEEGAEEGAADREEVGEIEGGEGTMEEVTEEVEGGGLGGVVGAIEVTTVEDTTNIISPTKMEIQITINHRMKEKVRWGAPLVSNHLWPRHLGQTQWTQHSLEAVEL